MKIYEIETVDIGEGTFVSEKTLFVSELTNLQKVIFEDAKETNFGGYLANNNAYIKTDEYLIYAREKIQGNFSVYFKLLKEIED